MRPLCAFATLIVLLSISIASANPLRLEVVSVQNGTERILPNFKVYLEFTGGRNITAYKGVTDDNGIVSLQVESPLLKSFAIEGVYALADVAGLGRWISFSFDVEEGMSVFRFARPPEFVSMNGTYYIKIRVIPGKILRVENVNPFAGKGDVSYLVRPPSYRVNSTHIVGVNGGIIEMLMGDLDSLPAERLLRANLARLDSGGNLRLPLVITTDGDRLNFGVLTARRLEEHLGILRRDLQYLESQGIMFSEARETLLHAGSLLGDAVRSFQEGDGASGAFLLRRAVYKLSDEEAMLSGIKSDSAVVAATLLVLSFFISTIIAELLERSGTLLHVAVFLSLVGLEYLSVPQYRVAIYLLTSGKIASGDPTRGLVELSLKTMLVFTGLGLVFFSFRNTRVSEFFRYSIRDMSRHKLRAGLAIATIALVSGASASFVSLGVLPRIDEKSYRVDLNVRGLVVRRSVHTTIASRTGSFVVFSSDRDFIGLGEAMWLIHSQGISAGTLYGTIKLPLGNHTLKVAVLDPQYMLDLGASPLIEGELKGVAVGRRVREIMGLGVGDVVEVGDKSIPIGGIVDEERILKIRDIDGSRLLEGIGPYDFIAILDVKEAGDIPFHILKVSLLVGGSANLGELAKFLLIVGYHKELKEIEFRGESALMITYYSYNLTANYGKLVKNLEIAGEDWSLESTAAYAIPLVLASLVIGVNQLGTVYHRKREIMTLSTLGATPLDSIFVLLIEGLAYGVLGGIAGYILGQSILIRVTPLAIASLSPQGLGPMLTSAIVALVPSVLGSLAPSRRIILEVVPSRLILRERRVELRIAKEEARIYMPVKLTGFVDQLLEYLHRLESAPEPVVQGIVFKDHRRVDRDEKIVVEVLADYKGSRYARFRVYLVVPRDSSRDAECIIRPFSGKWKADEMRELKNLALALREKLIEFAEWRKAGGEGLYAKAT